MRLLTLLLFLLAAAGAQGFGAKGHRVTGALAERHLTPEARAAVEEILDGGSLAEASTWADEMRGAPDNETFWGYDHAASWHFVNVGPGLDYAASEKSPAGDAYAALLSFIAILEGRSPPPGPVRDGLAFYFGNLDSPANAARLKAFALRFLVHLAGDLHQPLHVGYAEDQGGNQVRLRWFGESSNLHRVWDSQLLDTLGLGERALVRRLTARAADLPAAELDTLLSPEPAAWLDEGLTLRDRVYTREVRDGVLGERYAEAFAPLLEEQLLKSGLRLAALLNALFP